MLVAGEPAWRAGLRLTLAALGYRRIVEAETDAEAVARLRSGLVDLVLTPWERPEISGPRVMEAVARRAPRVPVVLLDDGLPRGKVVSAVKAGIAGKITLPGTVEEMRRVLETIHPPPRTRRKARA